MENNIKHDSQPAPAPPMPSERHAKLSDWVLHNGGYKHPNLELAYSVKDGYHMTVVKGKTISPRTRVLSCPMCCTLSVMNVLDVMPFPDRGTKFPRSFIDSNIKSPELLQTFFLMEQYVLGDQSWWSPYINTLPTIEDVNQLQFEKSEDAQYIKGTNLEAGYRELMIRWRGYYNKGQADLRASGWNEAKCESYTWERYRWAASIFGSRGFSSIVLSDTTPSEEARLGISKDFRVRQLFSERFSVLLPLNDILNHKPRIKIDWQPRTSFVGLQVGENYEEGAQLYNNYGPKDNESLLLSYGFVSEDKSFQHVALAIRPPPGTLLDVTRQWTIDGRSNMEHKLYILNADHFKVGSAYCLEASLYDYDLLDAISVLVANERESSAMLNNKQTLISTALAKTHTFEDFRNLLAVIGQILVHCENGRERLISTRPPQQPTNSKQHNANLLRAQQISHYEDALLLSKIILVQACRPKSDASSTTNLIAKLGQQYGQQSTENIKALTKRFDRITRHEELFSLSNLLDMLPVPTRKSLGNLIREIMTSDILTSAPDERERSCAQSRVAVFLSAAHHSYIRGLKIAQRLTDWLEHTTALYPPTDPSWSYVPTDGPWPPGEEPPKALQYLLRVAKQFTTETEGSVIATCAVEDKGESHDDAIGTLKQWLKPKSLCWAYNVMYEETVQVPVEIARFTHREYEDPHDGEREPMDWLLYMQAA